MEYRSLLGITLVCTVLGVCCLTKAQTANAEPASMFRAIIREIQTQLPRGWVMRLPSSVNISDNPLYPEVVTLREEFAVFLNSQPNCKARFCNIGIITVSKESEYANSLRSKPVFSRQDMERVRAIRQRDYQTWTESDKRELIRSEMAVLEKTPIILKQGIEGLFIIQNAGGASTPPGMSLIWKQDGLNYRVSVGCRLDRNGNVIKPLKSDFINLAISMADEPPIKSIK